MNFEWLNNESSKKTITIYNSNITLNKAACHHFENVEYVLLGIDTANNTLGIKPIGKQQIDDNIYQSSQLHRISIGKSYGRISNKNFIDTICSKYNINLENNVSVKYDAKFDIVHQILLVDL